MVATLSPNEAAVVPCCALSIRTHPASQRGIEVTELIAALGWLITPALVASVALGLVRFVDAGSRWDRRLRADLQLFSAMPDGDEKARLEASLQKQARRLREYRSAFGPRRQIVKWIQLLLVAWVIAMTIRYPPINTATTQVPLVPADYATLISGGAVMLIGLTSLIRGRDWFARTPAELLRNDRLKRHNRRERKANRLDKIRAELIAAGEEIRPKGSRLGFRTQVDELGPWMRTPELREAALTRGTPARDLDYSSRERARAAGQQIPRSH